MISEARYVLRSLPRRKGFALVTAAIVGTKVDLPPSALRATPANPIGLVMRRGMALTALGIAMGVGGAVTLARCLRSLLLETPAYDPIVLGAVAGLLLLPALGACALPALRASRPDVGILLKGD